MRVGKYKIKVYERGAHQEEFGFWMGDDSAYIVAVTDTVTRKWANIPFDMPSDIGVMIDKCMDGLG